MPRGLHHGQFPFRSTLAGSRTDSLERFATFDPATLYEAAGQKGMVDPSIRPAWPGARVCGRGGDGRVPAWRQSDAPHRCRERAALA